MRAATVTTVLGRITLVRALSACPQCGERQAPLAQHRQVAAGGLSLGLQERLALLGATQDTFLLASEVLARRCRVQVWPNSARAATEDLGAMRGEHDQPLGGLAAQTQTAHLLPVLRVCQPSFAWTGCLRTSTMAAGRR